MHRHASPGLRSASGLATMLMLSTACEASEAPFTPDFSAVDDEVARFQSMTMGLEGVTYVVVDREHGILHDHSVGDLAAGDEEYLTSSGIMLSSMVMLGLVDEGRIELDAPVAESISWGGLHPEITLAQLLSHTSGMPGISSHGFNYPAYACELDPQTTLGACAREIFTADLGEDVSEPGTTFQWGGGIWQVVGGIAEDITGKSWAQLVRERLSEPCELPSLRFVLPPVHPSVYDGAAADLPGQDNPSISMGAVANAEDYARLLVAHLRDGRCGDQTVLSPDMIAEMRVDRASGAIEGVPWGVGWEIVADNGQRRYVAQGLFGTVAWIDPDQQYGVFIGVQTQYQDGEGLADLVRPLIEDVLAEARGQ